MPSLYKTDYYRWSVETAKALREGRLSDVDLEAAAEEIEDLGKSERRGLHSALVQFFMPILKKEYQPQPATFSSDVSIEKPRRQVSRILEENPSLKPLLEDEKFMADVYEDAVLDAVLETGLPKENFPAKNPFGFTKEKSPTKRRKR